MMTWTKCRKIFLNILEQIFHNSWRGTEKNRKTRQNTRSPRTKWNRLLLKWNPVCHPPPQSHQIVGLSNLTVTP